MHTCHTCVARCSTFYHHSNKILVFFDKEIVPVHKLQNPHTLDEKLVPYSNSTRRGVDLVSYAFTL